MRRARIKIPPEKGAAIYHCITRTVNGEHLIHDSAKEILRCQLWQVAEFCGMQILTYAILSNHFHVLVRVPARAPLSDSELLRRHAVLYPQPTLYEVARHDVLKAELRRNSPEAQAWRTRLLTLMGDVSQFMKLLKQRFSIWFNKTHRRFGTLWAERFKSVLVEAKRHILQTMAAYIDLNAVRAGLTRDPKDYRFCGYAEAVAGRRSAQAGLEFATNEHRWPPAQAAYRLLLFGSATAIRVRAHSLSVEAFRRAVQQRGLLSTAALLRCRLRYLTDGAVLGTRNFVASIAAQFAHRPHDLVRASQPQPHAFPAYFDCGDITTLRRLRSTAPSAQVPHSFSPAPQP